VTELIQPAYVYAPIFDKDADIAAMLAIYNDEIAALITQVEELNLAYYTDLTGDWLDYVAAGVYGFDRPKIALGLDIPAQGGFTSFGFTVHEFSYGALPITPSYSATPDAIFIKVLDWHLYRADGFQFSILWLKRRLERFCDLTDIDVSLVGQSFTITLPSTTTTTWLKWLLNAGNLVLPCQYTFSVILT